MQIETTRFGTVEVGQEQMVTLPEGLLGFETVREYCLLPHAPGSPFLWLQATSEPSLAFVVINPFELFTEYEVEVSDADAERLRLAKSEDAGVLTVVTFSDQEITANLVGPIILNRTDRLAKQVVLMDPRYGTRHPLFASEIAIAS